MVEKKVVDDTPYASAKSFEELGLSAELLQGLYSEMKFERPSKIQGETLPMILTSPHRNLIAQAHNGSGKTTCFTLGMLSRIDVANPAPQALCICPTRELAIQNVMVMEKMGKYAKITIAYTADPRWVERSSRREKVDAQVVIGTPGKMPRRRSETSAWPVSPRSPRSHTFPLGLLRMLDCLHPRPRPRLS